MRIMVDEDGKKAVMWLVNVAVKAGAFQNVQEISNLIAAVRPIAAQAAKDDSAEGEA